MIAKRSGIPKPSLALVLFGALMLMLLIGGGSSRADVMGQAISRLSAWIVLVIAILFCPRPQFRTDRPVWILLGAVAAIPFLQLIPLPPAIWQGLPGRALLVEGARIAGSADVWRPIALIPSATLNALASLVVPLTILVLMGSMPDSEREWPIVIVLLAIAVSTLIGFAQFSGIQISNRLVNYDAGTVSGTFANRNHFALFLAMGCVAAPCWAFLKSERLSWRVLVAVGALPLLALVILASGSRAGMALGGLSILMTPLLIRPQLQQAVRRLPRWVLPAALGIGLCLIATLVLISVQADRATSIARATSLDINDDMRRRALPVIWQMIWDYFPVGTGQGGFDPLFRMYEPFELLKPTYFNNAHNDYLESLLGGGLASGALILVAFIWLAVAGIRTWKQSTTPDRLLGKVGWTLLLLVFGASVVDYPARTPIIMAVVTIATVWLNRAKSLP